jgi:hypothetical protein
VWQQLRFALDHPSQQKLRGEKEKSFILVFSGVLYILYKAKLVDNIDA